jgi:DMSO reductase family type II enzyme heme b subunit
MIQKVMPCLWVVLCTLLISSCGTNVEKCLQDESCGPAIPVSHRDGNLPTDPYDPFWDEKSVAVKVELGPQMITNPKWPNPSTREVVVRAAKNNSSMAIMLEWEDKTRDSNFDHSALYVDRAAVMFPVTANNEAPSITMGEPGAPVNIWQWKAIGGERGQPGVRDNPNSELVYQTIEDLNAEGYSTLTDQSQQDVKGVAVWKNNRWRLIFHRSLTNAHDNDVQFKQSVLMATAVWNGSNKELNGQKGIAGWLLLKLN